MGVIFMLLSSGSFAVMAALIKAVGPSLPLSQLVFLRCALALPFLLGFLLLRRRPLLVQAKKGLLLRTAFGMTAMHGFFYGLTHLPLADCIFITRTQPLLLALAAPFVVGEQAPRSAWLAIGTGLAGVALVMQPALNWPLAAWAALGGAAASAGAHLMVRRLNRTDSPMVIVFNFTLLTAVFTSFWAVPAFISPSSRQWLLIAGIALFASLGQMLMTTAYRLDRAPAIAAASYSSVILSILFGYLFWSEIPQPLAWAGGTLIVTGGLLLVRSRFRASEPA